MKIKTKLKPKSILSIILALNLLFPMGYINNINSYATTIDENEVIDKWETKTPMPTSRNYLASAVVDDKIYCIGGNNGSSYTNKVEVYDPATDTWETKASMPTSRGKLASAVVDGEIYCIGGQINSSFLDKVEVYDPTTDIWETKASMPTSRVNFISAVVDDKIYCIGGQTGASSYTNKVEVYDPVTNTWETKASMPTSRGFFTGEAINGKIYCIGGYNGSSYFNKVEVYDPETDSWETKTSMPTSRCSFASAVVGDKIYCIGGNNVSFLNTVEVYDPTIDNWETKTPMPTARSILTGAVVGGKIYCIGGYYDSSFLNTVEVYTPNINTLEYRLEQSVISAENSKNTVDIENARNLVNQLPEGDLKEELQNRLDAINPDLTLDIKNTTANLDVYIKSENMLLMSLSTNSITFEEYSGVEEIEKTNALTININSSLAYDLNAYLVSEIQNADGSNKIDIDRLNIKANNETAYQEFAGVNQKLTLKDNCNAGNDLTHNIDLKLKGGNAYEADIYKTVIKFEAEQK